MASKQILLVNASPRPAGHTQQILDAAQRALSGLTGATARACNIYGSNYDEIAAMWQESDGIILGAPVYTYGPPSELYAFFQHLRAWQKKQAHGAQTPKPAGLISQGGASYSGAEENASILQALIQSVHCVPVSADMPGFSQSIIGQVADQADVDTALLTGAASLAERVVDMIDILAAGQTAEQKKEIRLLVVQAGPGIDPALAGAVFKGAGEADNINLQTDTFDFHGKEIAPCLACTQYCSKDLECVYEDAMQDFRRKWMLADAVTWLVDAEEIGIDPALVAVIDRLNQTRFEIHFAVGQTQMPRYLKAAGILASGRQVERIASAVRFLRQSAVLYQNVPVPQEGFGGCGIYLDHHGRLPEGAVEQATILGKEAVELAVMIQSGLVTLKGKLPQDYYPSHKNYGMMDN